MNRRVILVGPEAAVLDLSRRLRADPEALAFLGAFVSRPARSADLVAEGIPVLGRLDQVVQALDDVPADGVLVAPAPETSGTYLRNLATRLRSVHLPVLLGPGGAEDESGETRTVSLREVDSPDLRIPARVARAVLDRLGAAVLLTCAAPFLLLIALVIKLDSPGPVLRRYPSSGQWGREFQLLRFRSNQATPVGRFLRRCGLDGLPQLINVFSGDMSLVGPRPRTSLATGQGGGRAGSWLPVKPGLTGLWHLRGASEGDLDGPVELDYYQRHWSPALDLGILVRSVRAAVRRGGGC